MTGTDRYDMIVQIVSEYLADFTNFCIQRRCIQSNVSLTSASPSCGCHCGAKCFWGKRRLFHTYYVHLVSYSAAWGQNLYFCRSNHFLHIVTYATPQDSTEEVLTYWRGYVHGSWKKFLVYNKTIHYSLASHRLPNSQ
jgi:hypothetical protein